MTRSKLPCPSILSNWNIVHVFCPKQFVGLLFMDRSQDLVILKIIMICILMMFYIPFLVDLQSFSNSTFTKNAPAEPLHNWAWDPTSKRKKIKSNRLQIDGFEVHRFTSIAVDLKEPYTTTIGSWDVGITCRGLHTANYI
jgi:hypothetical protein